MPVDNLIAIEVSLYDSGCLPALLRAEIEAVERRLRVLDPESSPVTAGIIQEYLRQLQTCLEAVLAARGAA